MEVGVKAAVAMTQIVAGCGKRGMKVRKKDGLTSGLLAAELATPRRLLPIEWWRCLWNVQSRTKN